MEHQIGAGVRIVNGRSEPVTFSESSGMSLLLTQGSHRYFQTRESLESFEELMGEAQNFDAGVGKVSWSPNDESYDFFEVKELLETLSTLHTRVLPQVDFLRSHSWITSTLVGVGLSEQSYVAVTSTQPGGMDHQFQVRLFAMATGKKGDITQEYYEAISANHSLDDFTEEKIAELFQTIVVRLEALLEAPAAPG